MKKKKKPNTKAPKPYPFKGTAKGLVFGPRVNTSKKPKTKTSEKDG